MRREQVQSEALRSIGYDPDERVLEVEFESGDVYRYRDVPPELHARLMAAGSHGEFFVAHVRNAGFDYEQVE
ncbi:KTSC domain-containing protein [Vulcaniibacterium tengchongense]|uniref:KTSC domain-containing protein n=1 Tax=Vulcaniibacterium tengchongense TaxID=1273429 RepID=A0A3N4W8N9_9GAMM|nr:KTSC domain-containing protein [Vulcaniibacterium tengchongense]RPE81584.1 KTSC domain-containing protein [Vulcaniibacterium tengchongense]